MVKGQMKYAHIPNHLVQPTALNLWVLIGSLETFDSTRQNLSDVLPLWLHRTNFQLSQDPDEDMQIVKDAVGYVKDTLADLKNQKSSVDWKLYTTGHSLGGFLATAVAVQLDPQICR